MKIFARIIVRKAQLCVGQAAYGHEQKIWGGRRYSRRATTRKRQVRHVYITAGKTDRGSVAKPPTCTPCSPTAHCRADLGGHPTLRVRKHRPRPGWCWSSHSAGNYLERTGADLGVACHASRRYGVALETVVPVIEPLGTTTFQLASTVVRIAAMSCSARPPETLVVLTVLPLGTRMPPAFSRRYRSPYHQTTRSQIRRSATWCRWRSRHQSLRDRYLSPFRLWRSRRPTRSRRCSW